MDLQTTILADLTDSQKSAVRSPAQRLLVIAGAGSGKTEVMARRVAWWVAVDGVEKDSIVAFTFTEAAAEELKFRIRRYIERITPVGEDVTLGGMYIGTIHGFCLAMLRELSPDDYHNYDVIDDAARVALVQRGYYHILGLKAFKDAVGRGQYAAMDEFLDAYDLLNEYGLLDVYLPSRRPPSSIEEEADWCKKAVLQTNVGISEHARTFSVSAARYYAYLHCRRFLDFSTSQTELLRLLNREPDALALVRRKLTHVVLDEAQDINPVQDKIIRTIIGETGSLTAVGDHRQAIYSWRGGRVDIMAHLYDELMESPSGEVIELNHNFRSTPRIIEIANGWSQTIGAVRSMSNPAMLHGRTTRLDTHPSHVCALQFQTREEEAEWIADTVSNLVSPTGTGALHDTQDGQRGLSYADIAVLLRSSTDARTYKAALDKHGIPAVFRAGPDLFSQPEVMLFVAALARMSGLDEFVGNEHDSKSLPNRVKQVLDCDPYPDQVVSAAADELRANGFPLSEVDEARLLTATELINLKISGSPIPGVKLSKLRTSKLVDWLRSAGTVRRVFPQQLFHWALSEAGVGDWESSPLIDTALFHLGQLSSLVTKIETPGWTSARDFRDQVVALCLWGAKNGRTEEAPLLVQPDAVTISTVHGAKGLEYGIVFLADVCSQRFPSSYAHRVPSLPFDGDLLDELNPSDLADNDNYDGERRLMYVALTRAERYLFVTKSGPRRSRFFTTVEATVRTSGGTTKGSPSELPTAVIHAKSEFRRDFRLITSFSDLRYYLECPHDFYLRKVLGFSPTIDQAFGYGRGVHNLMRAVHADPTYWARLAQNPAALQQALESLIQRGLFYLRYTTGEPAVNMRRKAVRIISDYIQTYAPELARLQFEPERPFETLLPDDQVLVSGAIDVIRLDDPPRVTLLDFKSGHPESDVTSKLDSEEMKLQVALYGLAAKHELEYEPEHGIVRYLGESDPSARELTIDLDDRALDQAKSVVVQTARDIRDRRFHAGPRTKPRSGLPTVRCTECDFLGFCSMDQAKNTRRKTSRSS